VDRRGSSRSHQPALLCTSRSYRLLAFAAFRPTSLRPAADASVDRGGALEVCEGGLRGLAQWNRLLEVVEVRSAEAGERFATKVGAGACSMLANLGFLSRLDVSSVAYTWKKQSRTQPCPRCKTPVFAPETRTRGCWLEPRLCKRLSDERQPLTSRSAGSSARGGGGVSSLVRFAWSRARWRRSGGLGRGRVRL
jgi:hypothetical protein